MGGPLIQASALIQTIHMQRNEPMRRTSIFDYYLALLRRLETEHGQFNGGGSACAVGLTSCDRREGVTTAAAHIALAGTRYLEGRVLLVDANIDHGSVGKVFGVNADTGLLDALRGQRTPSD